eukprot:SAG22_NODE_6179_length_889_cov_2.216456_1_plen_97_part_00
MVLDFNLKFKLVCKTFPNVYGTGKYSYNKKYQLKTRMEDLNDDSDMKRYFQALWLSGSWDDIDGRKYAMRWLKCDPNLDARGTVPLYLDNEDMKQV